MVIRKSSGAAATGLARQITGQGEQAEQMQLRTATVSAVNKGSVPWTVTINISGVLVPGVTMLGWYDPQVGDRVQVMKQGPVLLVMGTLAPGKLHTATVGAPPARPVGETAPARPVEAATREVSVQPNASATYLGVNAYNDSELIQGGAGIVQRGFYFYGNKIAVARGSGQILSGTILLRRAEGGAGQDYANVRLGTHRSPQKTSSALANPANVTVLGQLARGEGKAFEIPRTHITQLNQGVNIGFVLEGGEVGLKSPDFSAYVPFGIDSEWSGSLSLTVRG